MDNALEYRERYYSKSKTQKEMILEYMELYGSITPIEALTAIGSFRLGARIWDLKHDGYKIETELTGEQGYATYRLSN